MIGAPVRIDAHHHFWDPSRREYPWMQGAAMDPVRRAYGPADLESDLREAAIDGTVLVQTAASADETREFLQTAAQTSFVCGVVGWVDLTAPDVGDRIDALRELPGGERLVGIRHQVHDEPDPRWLCRDDVIRGLEAVRDRDLTYDILVRPRELPAAIDTVRAIPDLAFVLDHIAKPRIAAHRDPDWNRDLPRLAAQPNVSVKLSGMITEAEWETWTPEDLHPFVSRVLEWFGPERLMFGSDWPVCLLAAPSYRVVLGALEAALRELSDTESAQVFGKNARRFYGLTIGRNSAERHPRS